MKKIFVSFACCAFVLPLILSVNAYAASSVRSIGGNVSTSAVKTANNSARAASLPVSNKKIGSSVVKTSKTSAVQDLSGDSQRMPFSSHVSAITMPSPSTPTSTGTSAQQITDLTQRVVELEDRSEVLEDTIGTTSDTVSVIELKTDGLVTTSDGVVVSNGETDITLMDADGNIPSARLANGGTDGQVLQMSGTGMVWKDAPTLTSMLPARPDFCQNEKCALVFDDTEETFKWDVIRFASNPSSN